VVDFKDHALLDPPTNSDATEEDSNYLICQVSGFRVSRNEGLARRWDGLWVRRESLDQRHPQDRVRPVKERGGRGSVSPEPADVFVEQYVPPVENTSDGLLVEDGSGVILLEDGSILLLEDGDIPAVITNNLILESGDTLLLEDGNNLALEA